MAMRYLSVCSGVEAATLAWHPLGWEPAAFSEIDKFPSAVLAHHWPDVPNAGDFTTIKGDEYGPVQLLVGGTPCQSFSVAGLRGGIDDERGNLCLEFVKLADRLKPAWIVWENVPGVLSSNGGRDFGCFLGALGQLGYGFAYRILDAQYFGVPQRRRRVFVVGYLGDWRRAAAVLFERESLCGYPAPSREKGEGFTHDVAPCIGASGRGFERAGETRGQDPIIACRMAAFGEHVDDGTASTLKQRDYKDATDLVCFGAQNSPSLAIAFHANMGGNDGGVYDDGTTPTMGVQKQPAIAFKTGNSAESRSLGEGPVSPTLGANGGGHTCPTPDKSKTPAIVFEPRCARNGRGMPDTVVPPLKAQSGETGKGDAAPCVVYDTTQVTSAVRRLTPTECERLQGMPDNHTRIPWRGKAADDCPDGPRYKAIGNSMAVPAMRWIGERIQMIENRMGE